VPNIDLTQHPQNFIDRPLQIWVAMAGDDPVAAYTSEEAAEAKHGFSVEVTLHRPSLQPIYGGPTLLEALWAEMDRLMEGLMTGTDAEDEGDRYRAQELAWVLAIVTNAYNPSIDGIRAEAMRRWNEAQAAAEQDDMNNRPEGADQ
jgi:hypothetical protein